MYYVCTVQVELQAYMRFPCGESNSYYSNLLLGIKNINDLI